MRETSSASIEALASARRGAFASAAGSFLALAVLPGARSFPAPPDRAPPDCAPPDRPRRPAAGGARLADFTAASAVVARPVVARPRGRFSSRFDATLLAATPRPSEEALAGEAGGGAGGGGGALERPLEPGAVSGFEADFFAAVLLASLDLFVLAGTSFLSGLPSFAQPPRGAEALGRCPNGSTTGGSWTHSLEVSLSSRRCAWQVASPHFDLIRAVD
jgi:hypothetical protein